MKSSVVYRPAFRPSFVGNPLVGMVDQLFNRSISDMIGTDFVHSQPAVNIAENDTEFRLELAAPGCSKEDFNIKFEPKGRQLSLSVHKEGEQKESNEKYTRREFAYTNFSRTFTLPETVDADAIAARYTDGILHLSLPKNTKNDGDTVRNISIA